MRMLVVSTAIALMMVNAAHAELSSDRKSQISKITFYVSNPLYGEGDIVNLPKGTVFCSTSEDLVRHKALMFKPRQYESPIVPGNNCHATSEQLVNHRILTTVGPNALTEEPQGGRGWVAINDLYLVRSTGDPSKTKAVMDRYEAWLMQPEARNFLRTTGRMDASQEETDFYLSLVSGDDFMAKKLGMVLPADRMVQIMWIARVMRAPVVGPGGEGLLKKGEVVCNTSEDYEGFVFEKGTPPQYRDGNAPAVQCQTLTEAQTVKVGALLEFPTFVIGVTLADGTMRYVSAGVMAVGRNGAGDVAGARDWQSQYDNDKSGEAGLKSMALLPGLSNNDEAPEGDGLFFNEFSRVLSKMKI